MLNGEEADCVARFDCDSLDQGPLLLIEFAVLEEVHAPDLWGCVHFV